MIDGTLISEICDYACQHRKSDTHYGTLVPGLSVLCDYEPTRLEAMLYDPVVCLVLQGCKETYIESRRIRFGAGDSLIVSHSLPVVAAVTEASRQRPYVAMILAVDLGVIRSLYDEIGATDLDREEARSLEAAATEPGLIDAMARLFRASRDPIEVKALAPLIVREIHFRLLRADHGGMLRQLLWQDSAASKITKVINRIRSEFRDTMMVSEMAKTAGMSASAFHQHFKALTAKSPLQYQKELRLMEARRLLTCEGASVSSTAFEVGYESPTQFSREYSRKFGVSPRHDLIRSPRI